MKLSRITQYIFGGSAGTAQIAQFGSLAAGSPQFTTNLATIQALSEYLGGWFAGVISGNSPAIEDMNALFYLTTSQLAYLFQEGIPEYDSLTTYYQYSVVNYTGSPNPGLYASTGSSSSIGSTPSLSSSVWTPLAASTLVTTFGSSMQGVVPASGGGSANFLAANGMWMVPSGAGTVTYVVVNDTSGLFTTTGNPVTGSGSIALAFATQNASTILANTASSSHIPTFATGAAVTSLLTQFSSGSQGVVPSSGGGSANYLRADGAWSNPAVLPAFRILSTPTGSPATGSYNLVNWGSTAATIDNFSGYNGSTAYTVKAAGVYYCESVNLTSGSGGAGDLVTSQLTQNGSVRATGIAYTPTATIAAPSIRATALMQCAVNDTISVQVEANVTTPTWNNTVDANYMQIYLVSY
jgi:hypothetical protein